MIIDRTRSAIFHVDSRISTRIAVFARRRAPSEAEGTQKRGFNAWTRYIRIHASNCDLGKTEGKNWTIVFHANRYTGNVWCIRSTQVDLSRKTRDWSAVAKYQPNIRVSRNRFDILALPRNTLSQTILRILSSPDNVTQIAIALLGHRSRDTDDFVTKSPIEKNKIRRTSGAGDTFRDIERDRYY